MGIDDPCCSTESQPVEQQAIKALSYLDEESKVKVLEYIASLVNLQSVKNDKASTT